MRPIAKHFLGIGVSRAGTTWLYENLRRHPEIWMPPVKELHYFDRTKDYLSVSFLREDSFAARLRAMRDPYVRKMGLAFCNPLSWALSAQENRLGAAGWALRNSYQRFDDRWYTTLFQFGGDRLVGEITPAYSILTRQDIGDIRKLLPNTKLVLTLRDPIDRTWSNVRLDCARLALRPQDMNQDELRDLAFSPNIRRRSDYLSTLRNWLSEFSQEQLLILTLNEISADPKSVLQRVCSFLEVRNCDWTHKRYLYRVVNDTVVAPIPQSLEMELAQSFLPMLHELEQMLGSQVSAWRQRAEVCATPSPSLLRVQARHAP